MAEFFAKNSIGKIDCFCIECGEKRTFHIGKVWRFKSSHPFDGLALSEHEDLNRIGLNSIYVILFFCARDYSHALHFMLLVDSVTMTKIGQYPSVADISIGNKNKCKSALNKYYNEYSKALGLYAHGVGVGSFVYLRRIIENLVFDKFKEVNEDINVTESDFKNKKFDDKIKLHKDYLPHILVDNRNVYGIISKGIHELGEEECKSMFPVIQLGIEAILDDIITAKVKFEKEKQFSEFIANKTGELKQEVTK